jgi:long-subunit fatty acid transport protein
MPGNFTVGAAYELIPDLTLEGDFQYVQWSVYKDLKIDVTGDVANAPGTVIPATEVFNPATPTTSVTTYKSSIIQHKSWSDAMNARGGAEYKIDNQITVRAGAALDLSPQSPSKTEPMIPDGDRVDISLGASYKINENISLDFAYMLSLLQERNAKGSNPFGSVKIEEAGIPGIYTGRTHTISFNFGYAF